MAPKATSPWLDTVPDRRQFGALTGWVTADVAVIGGGIVGLMAAWNLAARGKSVVLLEKNHIATGDTGLTTAFLTRVPDAAAAELLETHGAAWLTRLFAATAETQRWFKDLVRSESLACDLVDCVSFNCSYDTPDAGLEVEWRAIQAAGAGASFVTGDEAAQCGMRSVCAAIRFDNEARFHIRKLVLALLSRPIGRRIQVFEETAVTSLEVGGAVTVQTAGGSVLCRSVICASGRPVEALPELRDLVRPVLTFAIAARYRGAPPMSDNLFWDTDEPYQYFRLLDAETVILGGCDRPAEKGDGGEAPHAVLASFLEARLPGPREVIYEWSGTLFETSDGLPYVAEHPHYPGHVFVATGFGGNGMVMGTLGGRIAADLVTRTRNPHAPLFQLSRTGVTIPKPEVARVVSTAREFVPVMKASEITEATSRVVTVKGRQIALFRVNGDIHAMDNACSHAGGPLNQGKVAGTVVTCPWHASQFDVTTGAVCAGPASRPQRCYAVRRNGDALEVEV